MSFNIYFSREKKENFTDKCNNLICLLRTLSSYGFILMLINYKQLLIAEILVPNYSIFLYFFHCCLIDLNKNITSNKCYSIIVVLQLETSFSSINYKNMSKKTYNRTFYCITFLTSSMNSFKSDGIIVPYVFITI